MKIKVNKKLTDINTPEISAEISAKIQIEELKQKLSDTDYIACKIAEGSATKEEYAEEIAQRKTWREEINKLEEAENV